MNKNHTNVPGCGAQCHKWSGDRLYTTAQTKRQVNKESVSNKTSLGDFNSVLGICTRQVLNIMATVHRILALSDKLYWSCLLSPSHPIAPFLLR